jgi:MOSC domain-containing protein YiiM
MLRYTRTACVKGAIMSEKPYNPDWDVKPEIWRGLTSAGSWQGRVVSLHIAPQSAKPMLSVPQVNAVADGGLEGDRFFRASWSSANRPDKAVTLIEDETVEAAAAELGIEVVPGDMRRNIVTRGVPLIDLLDREFTIGAVVMRGVRLFQPCAHLERISKVPGIARALLHRSGLKAAIVSGGTLRVGDRISFRTAE